ncbi:uncharacterized protein G2W53_010961 [Senna tora]|uniref:Uncharacterized protein n=1 Tax=Senna tora TaxID=362788 RepID=A0A835CEN0_9FABA|nr:uncharacterized protein G2W53_010961 [Senna tora]
MAMLFGGRLVSGKRWEEGEGYLREKPFLMTQRIKWLYFDPILKRTQLYPTIRFEKAQMYEPYPYNRRNRCSKVGL